MFCLFRHVSCPRQQRPIKIVLRCSVVCISHTNPKALIVSPFTNRHQISSFFSLEIAVEGKRQGVIKKKLNTEISQLKICKLQIFKEFMNICNSKGIIFCDDFQNCNYGDMKRLAQDYQQNWAKLKSQIGIWTKKDPELLNFVSHSNVLK